MASHLLRALFGKFVESRSVVKWAWSIGHVTQIFDDFLGWVRTMVDGGIMNRACLNYFIEVERRCMNVIVDVTRKHLATREDSRIVCGHYSIGMAEQLVYTVRIAASARAHFSLTHGNDTEVLRCILTILPHVSTSC